MTRSYRKAGVYQILFIPSGEKYIGGSTDISNRFTHHRYMLRRGIHKCKKLQTLWEISSEDDFSFEIIELCDNNKMIVTELEQKYLDLDGPILNESKSWKGGTGAVPGKKASDAAFKAWETKRRKVELVTAGSAG